MGIGVKQSVTLSFETAKQTQSKNENLETPVKMKKTTKVTQDQDVYIIESLREKKGNNFLVKWENYPEEENTWEPRTAIPGFILKFYDMDLKRLGQPAPSLPLEAKANATKVGVEEKIKTPIKKENKKATNKLDSKEKSGSSNIDTKHTAKKNAVEKPEQKQDKEEVYNIEALVEKKGLKYLVQWENFTVDHNTWEPRSSIPDFILQFYERDLTRLGMPAPASAEEAADADEKLESSEVSENENKDPLEAPVTPLPREATDSPFDADKTEIITKKSKTETDLREKTSKKKDTILEPEMKSISSTESPEKSKVKNKTSLQKSKPSVKDKDERLTKPQQRAQRDKGQSQSKNKSQMSRNTKEETHLEKKTIPQKGQGHSSSNAQEIKNVKLDNVPTSMQSSAKKAKQKPLADGVYIVEALIEKKGSRYLVKWENYAADQNTWEPRASIPPFILKYYEQDLSRLGTSAPSDPEEAKVKMLEHTKTLSDGAPKKDVKNISNNSEKHKNTLKPEKKAAEQLKKKKEETKILPKEPLKKEKEPPLKTSKILPNNKMQSKQNTKK